MERSCCRCSRRDFVRIGIAASPGAALGAKWSMPLPAQETVAASLKAKQVMLLWMAGAPSQLDTFDLKPGTDTGGPFRAIPTAAKEIEICEHLPLLAKQMKHLSVVRTVHSKDPNHETASYLLHTGYRRNPATGYPHVGSIVLTELGPRVEDLPGCVVLGGYPEAGAGYLPPQNGPLVLDKLANPAQDLVASEFVSGERLARRLRLLDGFDRPFLAEHGDEPRVEARRRAYESAQRLLTSERLRAFDLSSESEEIRDAYGNTDFGRAVLIGRRLLQEGVRFVEIELGGWDTHSDNFNQVRSNLGTLDPAFSALASDLVRLDLWKETLVVWMGEFGRTPRINEAQGRDHYTKAWSVVAGGGGVAGGRVIGRTDEAGAEIQDRPVTVGDLFATFYSALGIDAGKKHVGPGNRPIPILEEGSAVSELLV